MWTAVVATALLRGTDCQPSSSLVTRNGCHAYDNKCAQNAGYGGKMLQVPTVDASSIMTSAAFIKEHVKAGRPLLLKNASHLFISNTELFTAEALKASPLASYMVDVTASGREVANREANKKTSDPLVPLQDIFQGDKREVFFQAWTVEDGSPAPDSTQDHLGRPAKFKVSGDQSFDVSTYAFKHVKRKNPLFRHEGAFNFIMANEGGVLPHNHAAVFNILTQGAKRWTLVPPESYANHHAQKSFEDWKDTKTGTTYLSESWYSDHADDIKALAHYDFVQEAGDAVFFSQGMTHATLDLCAPTVVFIQKGDFYEAGTTPSDAEPDTEHHGLFRKHAKHKHRKGHHGKRKLEEEGFVMHE